MLIDSKVQKMGTDTYELTDHIYANSQKVELGANQLGFVVGFSAQSRVNNFSLELLSGTTKVLYDNTSTITDGLSYSSPMISSHLGSILVNNLGGVDEHQLRVIILTIKHIG